MRLSTAIRIGSMTTKQIRVKFSDGGNGRCALGAALDACNVHVVVDDHFAENMHQVFEKWPYATRNIQCPTFIEGFYTESILIECIWALNDLAGWSREDIANWVEQVEDKWEITKDGKEPSKKELVNING